MKSTAYFDSRALTFLRQLRRNNNREWFQENRATYEEAVLTPLRNLVEEMDVRFARFAPEIRGNPKRAIFRIHRDVRFSKDKSPYKTNAGVWFQHQHASHGVGSETHGAGAGFYFHLEPGGCFAAGGIWMPPRPALNAIRDAIVARTDQFRRTISAPSFARRFRLSEEAMLKRIPRGFAADHPAEHWLRLQSFTVSLPISDDQVTGKELPRHLERAYGAMLPLVRWMNEALGYPAAKKRQA